jgi:hypothetical protein
VSGNRAASICQRRLNRARQEQVPFYGYRPNLDNSFGLSFHYSKAVFCSSYKCASAFGAIKVIVLDLAGKNICVE